MLTGLHGFHVIVGTLFLGVALYRIIQNHVGKDIHLGFESAA
jgi:heme/copper-type cytochrome/quinol oxidase subunit 3